MANQVEDLPMPSAEIVGTAFVQQYYTILNQSPHEVYKFYSQDSVLSRPEANGAMVTVDTIQAITKKIFSLDCQYINILTVDSQFSLASGVIVLVTGYIVGNDRVKRRFTQTFFLATQETGGYVVLNDMFKFVADDSTNNYADGYVAEDTPNIPENPNEEVSAVPDVPIPSQTTYVEIDIANEDEVNPAFNNCEETEKNVISEKSVVAEKNVVEESVDARQTATNHVDEAASSASSSIQTDAPKKSFASIVNALSVNKAPFKAPPPKQVERPHTTARASIAPEALKPKNDTVSSVEKNSTPAAKAHAIFVANLPMTATVEELDKLFKQFGPIKSNGIQVRSNKVHGTSFGFVEFEAASSMQSAIKASPIDFASRLLTIEERRAASNDRGKFASGKGGYRNDNFRGRENYRGGGGRGNYGGGRSHSRSDALGESSQFSGQARGNGGPYAERAYQNGGKAASQASTPPVAEA